MLARIMCFALLLSLAQPAMAADHAMPEVSNIHLGRMALVQLDHQGTPLLHVNTNACREGGQEVCGFFKAQALAHWQAGHQPNSIGVFTPRDIAAADCDAASKAAFSQVLAAHGWLLRGQGRYSHLMPRSQERAETLRRCRGW